jgi:hypothetical protein
VRAGEADAELECELPRVGLVDLLHLRLDRSDASEVAITITPVSGATRERMQHRGWERLGAAANERQDCNRRGWTVVTEHYRGVATASDVARHMALIKPLIRGIVVG